MVSTAREAKEPDEDGAAPIVTSAGVFLEAHVSIFGVIVLLEFRAATSSDERKSA